MVRTAMLSNEVNEGLSLRTEVVITPFDAKDGRERFLVAIDHHHFTVDLATALLLENLRQPASLEAVAARMSECLGVSLDASRIRAVIQNELPKALFEPDDRPKKTPLSWQVMLFSEPVLAPLSKLVRPLFSAKISLALLMAVALICVLVVARYLDDPLVATTNGFSSWLQAFILTLTGMLIHELGHVAALNKFGGKSGGVGFGIYFIFPTFFADVTAAWRLHAGQRAVVDLGGLYLQSLYLGLMGAWALCAANPAVPMKVMWLSHFLMLYTLNPSLKFDGYWLISDLTRTSNLHERVLDTARKVVSRLIGRPGRVDFETRDLYMLVFFAVSAAGFFGYLLASLGLSLAVAIRSTVSNESSFAWTGWLSVLLLAILFVLVLWKCLRAIGSILVRPAAT